MSLDTQFLAFSCALLQSRQDELRQFLMTIVEGDHSSDSIPQLLGAFLSSEDFSMLWRTLGITFDILDDESEFDARTSPPEPNAPVYGMLLKSTSTMRSYAVFVGRNVVINSNCIDYFSEQYADLRREAALFYHRVTSPPLLSDGYDDEHLGG